MRISSYLSILAVSQGEGCVFSVEANRDGISWRTEPL